MIIEKYSLGIGDRFGVEESLNWMPFGKPKSAVS